MAISSLPSPYGIGTFGKAAYDFADFLQKSGQSYWQMLPLGPTSFGDSPYQSFSTYAGNPYYIDLDMLIADGLLTEDEVRNTDWGSDPETVSYEKIYNGRFRVLALAKERGWERDREEVDAFCEENARWLKDYTLYMACKRKYGMRPWSEWPEELRTRKPDALALAAEKLREDMELFTYIQYLFFKQWEALKAYIHGKGIRIIGDLPIYVAMDSSDAWSEQEFFEMDENGVPDVVGGVPPDYFTADGQLWGNPIYRWDKMKEDGYGWWIRRIGAAGKLYDVIRIDHFRGIDEYWVVPYGAKTAKDGEWRKGPGMELVSVLSGWFPDLEFIAEDLGFLTPTVRKLVSDSGWPGMKVLQFAFDSREPSNYLPHNYTQNCICYTGTHDNTTTESWFDEADPEDAAMSVRYLGLNREEGYTFGFIRGGMSSVANLFVAQMQDYLCQGIRYRMNTPGTLGGRNWCYRLRGELLTDELAERIRGMTSMYGRLPEKKKPAGAD